MARERSTQRHDLIYNDDQKRRLLSPPARCPPAPGSPRDCSQAAHHMPDPSGEHCAIEHRSLCYDRALGAPRCAWHHPAKRRGSHGRWGGRHRPASRLTPAVVRRAPAHDEQPARAGAQACAACRAAADGLCVPRARHARGAHSWPRAARWPRPRRAPGLRPSPPGIVCAARTGLVGIGRTCQRRLRWARAVG